MPMPPADDAETPPRASRTRTVLAAVFLALTVVLTPIAVTAVSAGVMLSESERFADTFAPVATDPALQAAVSQALGDAVVDAVAQQDPAAALEQYLKDAGASTAVQLSARALGNLALQSLETSARERIDTFIASDAFANLWSGALRTSHATLTGAVDDSTETLLRLDADGTIWLDSTLVAQAAADFLATRSPTIAEYIPTDGLTDVALAHDPSLAVVHTAVKSIPLLITIPLVTLGVLLVAGVLIAHRRWRALAFTAGAASILTVLFGVVVGGFSVPSATPQQAVLHAFVVPVQGLIAGPAVTVALIIAIVVLAGAAGALLLRNQTPAAEMADEI